MEFRSRIDGWLVLLLVGLPGWSVAQEWMSRGRHAPPASLWIALAVLALLAIALVPIRYVIEGETVIIRCGLIRWEYAAFQIGDIESIQATHNPLAAPALSLDRLRVSTGSRSYLISPGDKAGFLEAVLRIDPSFRLERHSLIRNAGR